MTEDKKHEGKMVSACCGVSVYWKEREYFGKYTKTIWICWGCNKPCTPVEVSEVGQLSSDGEKEEGNGKSI